MSRDPLHVAVIMDGNGRWAAQRGRPRSDGHRAGVAAVEEAVEQADRLGIGTLTLFAFSTLNWRRPASEVASVLELVAAYLEKAANVYPGRGVRVRVLGRRARLPQRLRAAIEEVERSTRRGRGMLLCIALDYSARAAISRAARRMREAGRGSRASFARCLARETRGPLRVPDVDLLIRTGGERRLSDFLLWECAHAELLFTPTLWPDFRGRQWEAALRDYRGRQRRFGGLPDRQAG